MARRSRKQRSQRKRQTRRYNRKQRGGGLKEDILYKITSAPNYQSVLRFFNSMESPVWHSEFPRKDGNTYIFLIKEGEVEYDNDPQKLVAVIMKITNTQVESVRLEASDAKSVKNYLDNFAENYDNYSSSIYVAILGASRALFNVGA
jgi:hypothetical protein